MANVRDSDTSLWLHNKLGTSNDSWTTGSICTQLNAEVLKNIKDCFPDLQTQVKLKLLLSFFHIPRRNVEEVTFYSVLWFCVTVLSFYLAQCISQLCVEKRRTTLYIRFICCHEFTDIIISKYLLWLLQDCKQNFLKPHKHSL